VLPILITGVCRTAMFNLAINSISNAFINTRKYYVLAQTTKHIRHLNSDAKAHILM